MASTLMITIYHQIKIYIYNYKGLEYLIPWGFPITRFLRDIVIRNSGGLIV